MSKPSLDDRICGALLGAAIGAELSFSRITKPDNFVAATGPEKLFDAKLEPDFAWKPVKHDQWWAKATPLIDLGVQAYLTAKGRALPEDFATVLKNHRGAGTPAFAFDGLHTVQELLKEGMHPRLSGLGNAPSGLVAAAMPAVGIYHFADPERAYLDGVELASVVQPRTGADWAGLCAAAIAAAFSRQASPESIIDAVLKIAHVNNKDVFYDLNGQWSAARGRYADEAGFLRWWHSQGGIIPSTPEFKWISPNPLRFVLPVLGRYHEDPRKLMAVLIATDPGLWFGEAGWMGVHAIPAEIAGAIVGAMHGPEIFPDEWRQWAERIVKPWLSLAGIVRGRADEEAGIISMVESMARRKGKAISPLHDRIKGAIMAGAIGNAMGSLGEGRFYWQIEEQHKGPITTVLDPRRLEAEDDNQMAMLLVETYIERDGLPVMARHFGKTWHERLNRDHFFPFCMGNAYDLIRGGWDPRITGHWSIVTGSTVMCMEPVGIYNAGDPQWAAADATAVSYMYQRGLDVTAAAMLAATVANALRADATVDSVCQAALDVAPRTPLKTFDRRPFKNAHDYLSRCLDVAAKYDDVLAARRELYDKCLLYHCIDPLELWGLALAMFRIAKGDVRQAAIGGTNIGRDADTIAGRAAMLSGALNGTAGIPKEWIAMFSKTSIDRIDRNAARVTDLVAVKKMDRMRRRQEAMK